MWSRMMSTKRDGATPGMARIAWRTRACVPKAAASATGPRTGTPWTWVPILCGSSSNAAIGLMPWPGFRAMFCLWLTAPVESKRVAELTGMSRAAVSALVATLERDGLWTVACAGNRRFRARMLIAADGANSRLARSLGVVTGPLGAPREALLEAAQKLDASLSRTFPDTD